MDNITEKLNDALTINTIVEEYIIEDGSKIGDFKNMYQMHIWRILGTDECLIEYGPAMRGISRSDEFISLDDAIIKLAKMISSLGNKIRFHGLVVPRKAVEKAELFQTHGVVSRYIVDYLPSSDNLAERWDVMVEIME